MEDGKNSTGEVRRQRPAKAKHVCAVVDQRHCRRGNAMWGRQEGCGALGDVLRSLGFIPSQKDDKFFKGAYYV